ncbi:hypothetical protein [Thalassospira xiamenensis]|uniref:Uncharacterized protein n=1 Tax=Thalassospira xiamenensis TaxID=220697 RepID=A0A285TSR8_9PROT|nr:hypothetical protein [Thalassospira xiamenensis]SOC26838.1 hypothetical protein SAMN05428964_105218 [Thalassospira xiamenensis]
MTVRVGLKGLIGEKFLYSQQGKFAGNAKPCTIAEYVEATRGRIRNYGLKPGNYINNAWFVVEFEDGSRKEVGDHQLQRVDGKPDRLLNREELYLSALPKTDFWELDLVYSSTHGEGMVSRIDWESIKDRTSSDVYHVFFTNADTALKVGADELQLLERGKVWRRAHGLPLGFASVEEHAAFALLVGEYQFVPGKPDPVVAINTDEADGLVCSKFGNDGTLAADADDWAAGGSLVLFTDRELGRQVSDHQKALITSLKLEPVIPKTEDEWEDIFKPIQNPTEDASFNGWLFDKWSADWEIIQATDPYKCWSWLEVDGKGYIATGLHVVDTLGYFITEKSWKGYPEFDVEIEDLDSDLEEDFDDEDDFEGPGPLP